METRVARVETSVENLHSEVAGVARSIKDLSSQLSARGAVNWGAISVLVTVIALAAALVGYVINDIKTSLQTHIESDGHPAALIEQARIDERVKALERIAHYNHPFREQRK